MDKTYALNSFQMKEIDTFTMEQIGIPSMVLMEKAAMAVVTHIKQLCEKQHKILAVCGYGNNGGDGVAVARMLHMEGYAVDIFMVGEETRVTKETRQHVLEHPELYSSCPARIRKGQFYTDEEYEQYVEESLNKPLPGEEKGIQFTKRK